MTQALSVQLPAQRRIDEQSRSIWQLMDWFAQTLPSAHMLQFEQVDPGVSQALLVPVELLLGPGPTVVVDVLDVGEPLVVEVAVGKPVVVEVAVGKPVVVEVAVGKPVVVEVAVVEVGLPVVEVAVGMPPVVIVVEVTVTGWPTVWPPAPLWPPTPMSASLEPCAHAIGTETAERAPQSRARSRSEEERAGNMSPPREGARAPSFPSDWKRGGDALTDGARRHQRYQRVARHT